MACGPQSAPICFANESMHFCTIAAAALQQKNGAVVTEADGSQRPLQIKCAGPDPGKVPSTEAIS